MKVKITTPNGFSEFISNQRVYLDIEVTGKDKKSIIIDPDGFIYPDGSIYNDNKEQK